MQKVNLSSLLEKYSDKLSKYGIKLSSDTTEEKKVELMSEGILADGTKVYTNESEWKVGVEVFVLDDNGNPQPLADGTYVLADGSELIVADGKVGEIATPEAEESETTKEEQSSDVVTKEEFESAIKSLIETFESKYNELLSEKTTLSKQVDELKKQPATTSVKQSQVVTKSNSKPEKSWSQMTTIERIQFNLEQIKK